MLAGLGMRRGAFALDRCAKWLSCSHGPRVGRLDCRWSRSQTFTEYSQSIGTG